MLVIFAIMLYCIICNMLIYCQSKCDTALLHCCTACICNAIRIIVCKLQLKLTLISLIDAINAVWTVSRLEKELKKKPGPCILDFHPSTVGGDYNNDNGYYIKILQLIWLRRCS